MSPLTGKETSDSFAELAAQLEATAQELRALSKWVDENKDRPQEVDVLHSTGVWRFVRGKLAAYLLDAKRKTGYI